MGKWLDNFKEKVSDWYNDGDQFYLRTITDPFIKLGKEIWHAGPQISEMFTPVYSDVMGADDMFNTGLNNLKSGNYLQGIVQTAGAPLLGAAFMAIPDAADAPIKGGIKAARTASSARTIDKAVDLSKISTTDAKKMYDDLMQQQSVLLQQLREAESIPGVRGNSTLQQKIYSNSNGAWVGNTWVTPHVDYSDRENAIQAIKDQINAVNQQIRNLSDAGHNFTGYSDDVTETSLKPRQYYAQASDGTVGYATQRTPRTRKPTKSTTVHRQGGLLNYSTYFS